MPSTAPNPSELWTVHAGNSNPLGIGEQYIGAWQATQWPHFSWSPGTPKYQGNICISSDCFGVVAQFLDCPDILFWNWPGPNCPGLRPRYENLLVTSMKGFWSHLWNVTRSQFWKVFGQIDEKNFANELGHEKFWSQLWKVFCQSAGSMASYTLTRICRQWLLQTFFVKVQIVQTPLADPQKYNGGVVQPPFNSSKIVETPPCRLSKVPSEEKLKREATPKNILHACIKYRPKNDL